MICYKCGTNINFKDKFCPKCGLQISYEAPQGKALLVFNRKCRLGCAIKMRLYVDDILIGKLKNSSEFRYTLPFGSHKITGHLFAGKKESIFIDLNPEKSIAVIDCWVDLSKGFSGNIRFSVL